MSLETPPPDRSASRAPRRYGVKTALLGAGVIVGAIGATAWGASAATGSSPTTGSSSSSASSSSSGSSGSSSGSSGSNGGSARMGPADGHQRGPGGAQPVRSDEKSVSTSTAATLKAAALKAVPGATVIRVETDAGDGAYEAHLKKSDGTIVTVKFDKNLAVTGVESGMGKGDPAPSGQRPNR